MVSCLRLNLLFFLLITLSLHSKEVIVEASINQNEGVANQPIQGTLTITHDSADAIKTDAIQFKGKSLETHFIQEVSAPSSADLRITIYSFELPSQKAGLYILDPISVKVGNRVYHSSAASYEVKEAQQPTRSPATTPITSFGQGASSSSADELPSDEQPSDSPSIFRLEAFFKGPTPFYPGQRAKLMYRISYNRSIDLTFSDFPLLHTQDYTKIGDAQIKDYQQGDLTVQEITQEIEAFNPGNFHYGPSVIEGYAYRMVGGRKIYNKTKLSAEAPAIDVIVKPFPKKNEPASYTGAIGTLHIKLRMLTSTTLAIGDNIELEIQISGATNLVDLKLPNLRCQPGFSGFFQLDDLPPTADTKNGFKIFKIEMRPISLLVQEIPSIEISSFDPKTHKFSIWRSQPIPLKIKGTVDQTGSIVMLTQPESANLSLLEQSNSIPVLPTSTSIIRVEQNDLRTSWIRTLWVLGLIPIALLLLSLQWRWEQKKRRLKATSIQKTSYDLFQQALNEKGLACLNPLKAAFFWRLKEKGHLKQDQGTEFLPTEGVLAEIRDFLNELDAFQYVSQKEFNEQVVKERAQYLFSTLLPK